MSGNNSATLAGNIATEPELRYTTGGTSVCEFVLAVNRPRSASGAADFVRVTAFGDDAETIANYKAKGHGIKVQGRLDHQSWKAQDGSARSTVKMIARKGGVTFLPKGSAISVNHVELMGNLTRDPELLKVGGDIDKANFGLAVDGMPIGDSGETDTDYFSVVAWRGLAEVVARYKQKGDLVHIEGRVTYSQWEQEGLKRSKIEVTAENIQFLPSGTGSGGRPKANASAHAQVSEANAKANANASEANVPAAAVPAGVAGPEDVEEDPFGDDLPF